MQDLYKGEWRRLNSNTSPYYSGVYTLSNPTSVVVNQFGANFITNWDSFGIFACGNFKMAGGILANNLAYWNGCP